jgi:multicomponent K+:H+ antiporter subunit G
VGCLLLASAIWFSSRGAGLSLHEISIALFLSITAPVSAHLLAKAALHLRLASLAPEPDSGAERAGVAESHPAAKERPV